MSDELSEEQIILASFLVRCQFDGEFMYFRWSFSGNFSIISLYLSGLRCAGEYDKLDVLLLLRSWLLFVPSFSWDGKRSGDFLGDLSTLCFLALRGGELALLEDDRRRFLSGLGDFFGLSLDSTDRFRFGLSPEIGELCLLGPSRSRLNDFALRLLSGEGDLLRSCNLDSADFIRFCLSSGLGDLHLVLSSRFCLSSGDKDLFLALLFSDGFSFSSGVWDFLA